MNKELLADKPPTIKPPILILVDDELPLNNKIGNIVESLNILPKIVEALKYE